MLSPVWTPIGSKFSIEQTITTLSFLSRITSSSYSFHPATDFSTRTCETGENSNPLVTISINSSLLKATPPPIPPSVKLGLTTSGNLSLLLISRASLALWAYPLGGTLRLIFFMALLNFSLSSALFITSTLAPINSTPYFSRIFSFASATAIFSPVWPPSVGSIASGLSFLTILPTYSVVKGSIYVLSENSGSVIIVAGFELTRTTL